LELKKYELGEHNVAEATVALTPEEFEKAVNKVYFRQRNSINMPGFRKGKVPRKMIEKLYGEEVFWEDAITDSLDEVLKFIVENNGLRPIGQAWPGEIGKNDESGLMEITMYIPNYPVVELGEYKGLKAVRKEAVVSDEEVDAALESVRTRNASIVTAERAAKLGDTVIIDYVGYIDGTPFAGGKAEGHSLEIGSKAFIDTFEVQLIGTSAGDDVEVNVTFPEDYQSENLRGKPALFKVHVHEIKEPLLPELDDEFAKDVSEYETLEEYRAHLREELMENKTNSTRDAFLDKLLEQLIETTSIDLHESLIDDRVQSQLARQSANMGIDYESYAQIFNMQNDSVKDNLRKSAERNIRAELILAEIAKREDIKLDDEDKAREYQKLADDYGVDTESLKTFIDVDAFENGVFMTKIADYLISQSEALPESEDSVQETEESAEAEVSAEPEEAEETIETEAE
jgi:trigger factor